MRRANSPLTTLGFVCFATVCIFACKWTGGSEAEKRHARVDSAGERPRGDALAPVKTLAHSWRVTSTVFSPDGKRLIAAGGLVAVYDTATWRKIADLLGTSGWPAAFSPDGRVLATSTKLWNATTWDQIDTLPWGIGVASCGQYSPDGRVFAEGTYTGERSVILWDTATWKEIRRLSSHGCVVQNLAFSPDGRTLATGCSSLSKQNDNNVVRIFETATGAEFHSISPVYEFVAFSHDGTKLATATFPRGGVTLWNTSTWQEIARLEGAFKPFAFSPSDRCFVANGSAGAPATIWETANWRQESSLKATSDLVSNLAFSPDGKTLAVSGGMNVDVYQLKEE